MQKIVLTVNEACKQTGMGRTTIFKLLSEGKLSRRKVGNRTYIVPSELRALFGLEYPHASDQRDNVKR